VGRFEERFEICGKIVRKIVGRFESFDMLAVACAQQFAFTT
jgi:hypothetical protein